MTLAHYGLAEPPYSITPDPRFVHLGERHRDALAHLRHGIETGGGGGFVQLTGEIGTGKTTLLRLLLSQLPDDIRVALVLNPRLGANELLEAICDELGIDTAGLRGNGKALVDALNAFLLDAYAKGLRVVLVIDEAQALPLDTLEQVRLLTNLETDTQKLLQVLLLGQPELRDIVARDDMRQLAQRITARFHLTPLDAQESGAYLRHRFRVAGGAQFPFTPDAVARLHARAGGVPRLLNAIAGRALLAGYARDTRSIDVALVDEAADEVLPPVVATRTSFTLHKGMVALVVAAAIALGALGQWLLDMRRDHGGDATAVAGAAAGGDVGAVAGEGVASADGGAAASSGAGAHASAASGPHTATGGSRTPATSGEVTDADAFGRRIVAASPRPGAAWTPLLRAWKLPATPQDTAAAAACITEIAPGVYCVRARASLDRLLATARPALLRLRSEGHETWALLRGGDGARATLWVDGSDVTVERLALDGAWTGDYVALWRGPPALVIPARMGDQGATVDWISARLGDADSGDAQAARAAPATRAASATGAAATAGASTTFDATLRASLLRFQRARGLSADGVAGPETMLVLAAALPGPRLGERER